MKVISEYKLDWELIKAYRDKGYAVYYGYEDYKVDKGESVGFLLDSLYPTTIMNIENILRRKVKSNVTLKYNGETWTIKTIEDWNAMRYDAETNKCFKYVHPVLEEYNKKRLEYTETKLSESISNQFDRLEEYINLNIEDINIPDVTMFVRAFAHLYDLEVDYENKLSLLNAYINIKYYMDNNIGYVNEIECIPVDELPDNMQRLFDKSKSYTDVQPEVYQVGDETMLEDLAYKTSDTNIEDLLKIVNSNTDYQECLD